MFTPKTGRLVTIKGSKAQCIAQAVEVAIPKASQFIFNFIIAAKIHKFAIRLQSLSFNK